MNRSYWKMFTYWLFKKTWFPVLRDTRILAIHLSEIEMYRETHGTTNNMPDDDAAEEE
jgi:hypothetical protein